MDEATTINCFLIDDVPYTVKKNWKTGPHCRNMSKVKLYLNCLIIRNVEHIVSVSRQVMHLFYLYCLKHISVNLTVVKFELNSNYS